MERVRPIVDLVWLDRSVACLKSADGLLAGVGIDSALLDRLVYARHCLSADEHVAIGTALRSLYERKLSRCPRRLVQSAR